MIMCADSSAVVRTAGVSVDSFTVPIISGGMAATSASAASLLIGPFSRSSLSGATSMKIALAASGTLPATKAFTSSLCTIMSDSAGADKVASTM